MTDPRDLHASISQAMGEVLIGHDAAIEALTVALLTRGHVLLEGVPGVAKTTMAMLFARATGLDAKRIQMTPDILPADITGTYVYREGTGEFVLRRGPVFSNLVIADEINRATPKTQSALLEAMQERQVTIEGNTHSLTEPFIVIATQNPVEMEGTFELPVAQRDRFQQKLTIDLPAREIERQLLDQFDDEHDLGPAVVEPSVSPEDILEAREYVTEVHVETPVKEYVLDIVAATREHPDVSHGASPRAAITILHAAKARAAIAGREYVIPDDVKGLLGGLLAHRLLLSTEAELSRATQDSVVAEIIDDVPPPGSEAEDFAAESQATSPDPTS